MANAENKVVIKSELDGAINDAVKTYEYFEGTRFTYNGTILGGTSKTIRLYLGKVGALDYVLCNVTLPSITLKKGDEIRSESFKPLKGYAVGPLTITQNNITYKLEKAVNLNSIYTYSFVATVNSDNATLSSINFPVTFGINPNN